MWINLWCTFIFYLDLSCWLFAVSYYRMSAICGMTAGGLGQFLASPADLVKVQMQMEGRRKLEGLPTR